MVRQHKEHKTYKTIPIISLIDVVSCIVTDLSARNESLVCAYNVYNCGMSLCLFGTVSL